MNQGQAEDVWLRIRHLRSNPPGHAGRKGSHRRKMFSASIEQFEGLMNAAMASGYSSMALPLYYALNQATSAIAAAHLERNWKVFGHGLKWDAGNEQLSASSILDYKLLPGNKGSFPSLCTALNSPVPDGSVELGRLWMSIPEISLSETEEGGLTWPPCLTVERELITTAAIGDDKRYLKATIGGLPLSLLKHDIGGQEFESFFAQYPTMIGWSALKDGKSTPYRNGKSLGKVELQWKVPDDIHGSYTAKQYDALLERLSSPELPAHSYNTRYIRPATHDLDGTPQSIAPLATWHAVLYGLSVLTRYYPVLWVENLDLDNSEMAVILQFALDKALRLIPVYVFNALTEDRD